MHYIFWQFFWRTTIAKLRLVRMKTDFHTQRITLMGRDAGPYALLSMGLIIVGVIWLIVAWNMSTTVMTDGMFVGREFILPREVHNIGLQDEKRNHLTISIAFIFLGVIGLVGSRIVSAYGGLPPPPRKHAEPDLKTLGSVQYKLWLIEKHHIIRSEVLSAFICDNREFATVDEALRHAHELECSTTNAAKEPTSAVSEAKTLAVVEDAPTAVRDHDAAADEVLQSRLRRAAKARSARRKSSVLWTICIAGLCITAVFLVLQSERPSGPQLEVTPATISAPTSIDKDEGVVADLAPVSEIKKPVPPTSVVSSSWLVGWWSENGFCEGDAGETFLADGLWGNWGVQGDWKLDGDRLTITESMRVRDTASGEPEAISPPRTHSGLLRNASENSFELDLGRETRLMERCEG